MKTQNTLKYFTLSLISLLFPCALHLQAQAASTFELNIEPLVGYELVQKILPNPHTKNRLMYGARVTAGIPLVSAEAEYTRSTDTETYPDQDLTIKDTDNKLKLGARSTLTLSRFFRFTLRAGGQAKQSTHEITEAGMTRTTTDPIVYRPYAGAGLSASLSSKINLSGTFTVVFNDFPNMSQNEYQTTLGFAVKLP